MPVTFRCPIVAAVAAASLCLCKPMLPAQQFVPKGRSEEGSTRKPTSVARVRVPLSSRGVDHISTARIDSALNLVSAESGRGASINGSRDGRVAYVLNRRTDPSAIEVHCHWDDILIVKSGEGILRHGANVSAPKRVWNYEWRAQRIDQATEVTLRPGDVVRVPAGEAHEIRSTAIAPLVYLTVKTQNESHDGCKEYPYEGK
jgi:mannose-6-phosphate isomerase-like protein (cupin superfamily)